MKSAIFVIHILQALLLLQIIVMLIMLMRLPEPHGYKLPVTVKYAYTISVLIKELFQFM